MNEDLTLDGFCYKICDRLAEQMSQGNSFLQKVYKANWEPTTFTVFNPFAHRPYNAINTVALSLEKYDDARWISMDEAIHSGLKLKAREKGSVADFSDSAVNSSVRAVNFGGVEKKVDTDRRAGHTNSFKPGMLFNANQFIDFPAPIHSGKSFRDSQPEYLLQFIDWIMHDSKAQFNRSLNSVKFDHENDQIFIPEKDMFKSDRQFSHFLIRSLIQWTGHHSRLDRPVPGTVGTDSWVKEELCCAIAGRLLGESLRVGYDDTFPGHSIQDYIALIKNDPMELWNSCHEAQRSFSFLEAYLINRDLTRTCKNHAVLVTGDDLFYNGVTYRIIKADGARIEIKNLDTGQHAKISPTDVIYGNLLRAQVSRSTIKNQGLEVDTEKVNNAKRRR